MAHEQEQSESEYPKYAATITNDDLATSGISLPFHNVKGRMFCAIVIAMEDVKIFA